MTVSLLMSELIVWDVLHLLSKKMISLTEAHFAIYYSFQKDNIENLAYFCTIIKLHFKSKKRKRTRRLLEQLNRLDEETSAFAIYCPKCSVISSKIFSDKRQ